MQWLQLLMLSQNKSMGGGNSRPYILLIFLRVLF